MKEKIKVTKEEFLAIQESQKIMLLSAIRKFSKTMAKYEIIKEDESE